MSCPTCDHHVACIGITNDGFATFWCPRCGSLSYSEPEKAVDVPKLVDRCRKFAADPFMPLQLVGRKPEQLWVCLGIAEAINLPENRT